MQPVSQALDEVKQLYKKVLGATAPEIHSGSYLPFPPGVDPYEHAVKEVDQLKQLSEHLEYVPRLGAWTPPADSFFTDDGFVIRMEIPGVDRDTLKVFLVGGDCVVRGERRQTPSSTELHPLQLERVWGSFERRFTLPAGSYPDRVTARYTDGVLELRVAAECSVPPKERKVEVA
jgi:HSP20 family protein